MFSYCLILELLFQGAKRQPIQYVQPCALCVVRSRLRVTHDHCFVYQNKTTKFLVEMAETQPKVNSNVEKASTKTVIAHDFLDWYPCSFEYLKEFVRPRDDWLVSQRLYNLFNNIANEVPDVSAQKSVPVPSATKKSSRKKCGHLRGLDVDLESIRVSALNFGRGINTSAINQF